MVDCSDLVAATAALDTHRNSSNEGQKPLRGSPYKYDIHVTGDLYSDDRDNGATTKVSVKIVGNEDGDVFVKQDDSFDSESQNSGSNGETRNPQFTTKRSENGGLELHIRALPLKPKASAPATIVGGGTKNTGDDRANDANSSSSRAASRAVVSRTEDTPSRLRTIESYSRVSDTRANTRMSEYARSRLSSGGQSFMEIRPAFEDASIMSDSECVRESRAQTRLTAELCASPVLVGGGRTLYEPRPRSQSMTKMEDKSTMTTWRGIPDGGIPTRNSSRASVSTTATTVHPDEDAAATGKSSPALSVIRGGGPGCYHGSEGGVFSAFNGPPVAPPETRTKGRDGSRGRSLPMDKYALPPRRSSKDKVNYRERVENLLTQYYPEPMLRKYLDELRRRYRFMGTSEMSSSEILKLLMDTTTDTKMKEQLRASVEELLKTQPSEAASSSDNEQTVASSPSQRHYLSIRETELRDVLDRTSISPVPKGIRASGSEGLLVGGGMSMDQLSPVSPNFGTVHSDRMSVAASVAPAESVHNDNPSVKAADYASAAKPESAPEEKPQAGASSGTGANGRAENLDPRYWDDDEKYRMKPPNMRDAFTILKSQPIFVRDMPSSDIAFKSPFSRQYEAPARDQPSDTHASDDSQSGAAGSRPASGRKEGTNSFSEKHPAESKVAKAVSELEEVLRRTEADALAGIESDFHEKQSCRSRCCAGERAVNDAESVASQGSLVGGGASSRSASVSTRISAMESKLDSMRPDSANKLWASDSTIRTDALLTAGKEFGDADQIDNDGNTEAGDDGDDEAAAPSERGNANESSVSLPMRLEDMSAELAAVLRRTGGVDDLRLKRTKSPVYTATSHSRAGTALPRDTRPQASSAPTAKAAEAGSSAYRSAARSSAGTASAKSGAANSNSLSELDVVMGRTGGAIDRSALSSRASVASQDSVLRGGSGTPGSPVVANDSENELASVMRRTTGYVPSVSSIASPAASDNGRPDTAASDLKSVRDAVRANTPSGANGYSSPQPAPRSATRASAFSPRPPVGSIAGSSRGTTGAGAGAGAGASAAAAPTAAGPPTYASSPLRGPAYQPSERIAPSPGQPSQYSRPPQQQPQAGASASRYRSPSPELYRMPTPVFGRFPSPPAHIKNRARENYEQENGGGQQQPPQQHQQEQEQPGSSRYRPHSHSVGQRASPEPADQYQEEPVVDRLDLETGSLASRRSRPRQGSEFGSSSTLTNGTNNGHYNIPKVVEEDVDSLASYPNMSRTRTPVLVGGGNVAGAARAQSTLRGGGVLLPAFTEESGSGLGKKCETGCCGVCGKGVEKSDVVVRPQVMHASCLRCEACDCLLTSSTFRAVDGHVYCERDYKRYFESRDDGAARVVAARSDKRFEEMNRAIMESFTSVDDFLQHMQQLRAKNKDDQHGSKAFGGDQAQVRRNGDIGVDRQTHYEREQSTSPSGTPWITERVVDKKVKTKVLEKRYPASAADTAGSIPASVKSRVATPQRNGETLVGGGNSERPGSNASRPSTVLLNDTKSLNGWDHPLCPGCSTVVYLNDRVVHEGYGYHRTCMRCRQCSQVVPTEVAIRIKGAIYCKKHGAELLRRRSILMRKKSTMGRRSRHHRRRSGVSRERFVSDGADVPPVPNMPMFSGQSDAASLPPPPSVPGEASTPRRLNTALRNFLDAAAEQIDNGSIARTAATPASFGRAAPSGPSTPMPQGPTMNGSEARRPLPVPRPKTANPPGHKAPQQQQQSPFYNRPVSPPRSPQVPTGQRSGSRSIFANSRESHYDSHVVNALRQEAQRQINGSQASMSPSWSSQQQKHHSRASSHDLSDRYLSPCGPSIAEVLNFGALGRQQESSANASSQFDPFADSHDQLLNGSSSDFAQQQLPRDRPSGAAFSPNVHLDNLERRFRNANFRPPWALKSQTMFE